MTIPKIALNSLDTVQHQRRVAESINNIVNFEFDESRQRTAAEKVNAIIPENPAYPPGHGRRYGVKADGVTDDAAALNRAFSSGHSVELPEGDMLVGSALTIPASTYVYGSSKISRIVKGFNGDLCSVGAMSTLENFEVEGQGATYTGGLFTVDTGDLDEVSWRKFLNLRLLGAEKHCIEFTAAKAGYASQMIGCRFTLAGSDQYVNGCVKMPDTEANNGNRFMIGCWSFGYRLFDAAGVDNFIVTGCQGALPIFTADSKKVTMHGCRIVQLGDSSSNDLTIMGFAQVITGCVFGALDFAFDSSMASCAFGANSIPGGSTFTDNATGVSDGNDINIPHRLYTPSWTSTGTAPDLGSGTIGGAVRRFGDYAHVNIRMTTAADTTYGTGYWKFSLPYAASRRSVGSVFIVDSSGSPVFVGIGIVDGGTSDLYVLTAASTTAYMGASVPQAWATGDSWSVDISYAIE